METMSAAPILFALFALALGACAITVRHAWVQVGTFCLAVALAGAIWQTSLGRPRPPLFDAPVGTVVGYRFDEPHAIYLWMLPPGGHAPTAFALPWSERQAAQLQQAAEQARKAGEPLQARGSGQHGPLAAFQLASQKMRFYPAEHQALPPKASLAD
jgi:hypothetical protein